MAAGAAHGAQAPACARRFALRLEDFGEAPHAVELQRERADRDCDRQPFGQSNARNIQVADLNALTTVAGPTIAPMAACWSQRAAEPRLSGAPPPGSVSRSTILASARPAPTHGKKTA